MLSDVQIRKAVPSDKPYKLADSGGLYLYVTPSGGRLWRLKYRADGKERKLSIGPYPAVTLAMAREKAAEAKRQLAQGIDPSAAKKAAKAPEEAPVRFVDAFEQWFAWRRPAWTEGTAEAVYSSVQAHALPSLGNLPIAGVKPADVLAVCKAVDEGGAGETAGRVFQRIKAVYRYSVTHGMVRAGDDPTYGLRPSEFIKPRRVEHRAALGVDDLPEFFKALSKYQGYPVVALALRLLMLTAVRPGELRGAKWSEFDFGKTIWRVPAERMKMKEEHIVPLSKQALAIIQRLREYGLSDDFLLPSPFYPNKPISDMTFNSALARIGYKGVATAHGFRTLFSTQANENNWHPDIIELQLAHAERNQVRAAYNRAQRIPDRVKLMQWWGDYLDAIEAGRRAGLRVIS